jgi:glycerol-3-phosphate dehydrogenase
MKSRKSQLTTLNKKNHFSVVIVGAGINGIGTFRDLSLQGVDCLLIDKNDFMSGASSAPSRMIHGGLRYLETGDFALVREGVRERNRLLVNAPHLVKPLPTTIPVFTYIGGVKSAILRFMGKQDAPLRRGLVIIKIGLMIYDLFSKKTPGIKPSRVQGKKAALAQHKNLNYGVCGTATYYDACITHPERLAMELLESAVEKSPDNLAINYLALSKVESKSLCLSDSVTGEQYTVTCDVLINASGAWIDSTNKALGSQTDFIGGTKGSHLIINNQALYDALAGEMIYFEDGLGRVCLLYPFHNKVLVGTTDIKIESPDEVNCTDKEQSYLIKAVKRIFPRIPVSAKDVVFRYSGVRPLASSEAASNAAISREHFIERTKLADIPVLSLVGGKWTTFRSFSEEVTDNVLSLLAKERGSSTADLPIGGGAEYPSAEQEEQWFIDTADKTGQTTKRIKDLFSRYGTEAKVIAVYCAESNDKLLQHHDNYTLAEIQYLLEREMVVELSDLLLRRTLLAITGELSEQLINELAEIMAKVLGWSLEERVQQVSACIQRLKTHHNVSF